MVGHTPLYVSCAKGQDVCVLKLIEIGADISIQDLEGMIQLHYIDYCIELIKAGADMVLMNNDKERAFDISRTRPPSLLIKFTSAPALINAIQQSYEVGSYLLNPGSKHQPRFLSS